MEPLSADLIGAVGPHWAECLDLAVQAAAAGSLGIAAIVVNSAGVVVGRGRNQLFDESPSPNPIKNTMVSHAELNALATIGPSHRTERGMVLYTTMEPCPMCLGAIVMSPIKSICVGIADPWAGACGVLKTDPYCSRKGIAVRFEDGLVQQLCFYVGLVSERRRFRDDHPYYRSVAAAFPSYYARIETLEADGDFMDGLLTGDIAKVLASYLRLVQ